MALYGLLGRKLGHSYSAPIHLALGCPSYELLELEPEAVGPFLTRRDFAAVNVTIPYKRTVMDYLDEIRPEAREIGSVNTIVNRAGCLTGCNTDIGGFEAMAASAGITLRDKKVVILGSGGTSLTARHAAKRGGAREIVVVSRSGPENYENLSRHRDADILVNTTPVGMYPACPAAPVSLAAFDRLSGVLDVIYNPARTALLMEAEALGIPHAGGLTMLVAQAKLAEERFFDHPLEDALVPRVRDLIARDKENIVLIGMPGCGKTTVGKLLARLTGREAVETDRMVEDAAGMTIPEIFSRFGEEHFRRLETEAAREAGRLSGKIITCGGGIVTRAENRPLLRQNGRIYELQRPIDRLDMAGRPLSTDREALRRMFVVRRPLYDDFRDAVIQNTRSVREAAESIWREYCEHFGT